VGRQSAHPGAICPIRPLYNTCPDRVVAIRARPRGWATGPTP